MNLFVAVEGIDGSGKTSLVDYLVSLHPEIFIKTAEPAQDCACYDDIRRVLNDELTVSRHLLVHMFAANRYDHIQKVVDPIRMDTGMDFDKKIVLCDRYLLSSLAYQGDWGDGFDLVYTANQDVTMPNMTLFLHTHPEIALKRVLARSPIVKERFDTQQHMMAQRYERATDYARNKGMFIAPIDANGTLDGTCVEALRCIIHMVENHTPSRGILVTIGNHLDIENTHRNPLAGWAAVAQKLRSTESSLMNHIKETEKKL